MSGQPLQTIAGEDVAGRRCRRVLADKIDEDGSRQLRSHDPSELLQVVLLGLPAAGRVRPGSPRRPTSPNGVILGMIAVTVMPRPARRDSSWAYPAMNRCVAFAPA